MDNLTHSLVGLALGRAGLNRTAPHASWILLLAANAPDLDVISALGGSLSYLTFHRHFTHAVAFVPLMAVLPVLIVRLAARKPLPWGRAWLVSLAGVASHPLLDWTNVYGVRLLLPFSDRWFQAGANHVVDFWIWAVLLAAFAAPALARLVSSEIGARPGSGRGWAWFALVFVAAWTFGRSLAQSRAVAILDSRLYQGSAPVRVAAFPEPGNPLRWRGLVETASFHALHDVDLLRDFDPEAGRVLYKPESSAALEAARRDPAVREFLGFAQYPAWRVSPPQEPAGETRVEVFDLRFGTPREPRFITTVLVGPDNVVRRAEFRFGARN